MITIIKKNSTSASNSLKSHIIAEYTNYFVRFV